MTGMFDDDDWGHTVDSSGDFARVEQLQTHLLIVFPRGYIEHHPTRFSQPGKKSDVIVCDIVDLDAQDEHGNQGKVYRNAWLRQSQLIISLRPFIDKRVLGRINKGISRNGMNPPWVIADAVSEPGALDRAKGWAAANPAFTLSPFDPTRLVEPQVTAPRPAPQQNQGWSDPWATRQYQPPPAPVYQQPPGTQQFQQQMAPPPQQYQQPYPIQAPVQPPYTGQPDYQQQSGHGQQAPPEVPRYPVNGAPGQGQSTIDVMRAQRARREEVDPYGADPPF